MIPLMCEFDNHLIIAQSLFSSTYIVSWLTHSKYFSGIFILMIITQGLTVRQDKEHTSNYEWIRKMCHVDADKYSPDTKIIKVIFVTGDYYI